MSRRTLKAASVIRQVIANAILLDVRDPRVRDVTVIGVDVAGDMRSAKVLVSVMGDKKKQELALKGLQNSAGFLQQRIGEQIDTRYIPKLTFVLDQGVKQSLEISRILGEVLPKEEAALEDAAATDEAEDAEEADEEAEDDTNS